MPTHEHGVFLQSIDLVALLGKVGRQYLKDNRTPVDYPEVVDNLRHNRYETGANVVREVVTTVTNFKQLCDDFGCAQYSEYRSFCRALQALDDDQSCKQWARNAGPKVLPRRDDILGHIRRLREHKVSTEFRRPVDYIRQKAATYYERVKKTMDLTKIKRRIKAHQYFSLRDLLDDFDLMVENAIYFNGKNKKVSKDGEKMRQLFLDWLENPPQATRIRSSSKKRAKELA